MGMPGMMQQMMRTMMGGGAKPLYPAMMVLPPLDQVQRAQLEQQAEERVRRGTEMVTRAQAQLSHPATSTDAGALARASAELREGISLVESGVAARRVLASGAAAQPAALAWFKRELGLAPPAALVTDGKSESFSQFHLLGMAALVSFGLFAIAVWWRRSRRIAMLMHRLTEQPSKGAAPPAEGVVYPVLAPSGVAADRTSGAAVRTPPPVAIPATRPGNWRGKLRVAAIFDETPVIKTLRLIDPDGGAIPFDFLPGQFLWITVPMPAGPIRRSYTIASSPTRRDYLEITVKREDKGIVSTQVHTKVGVGDLIEIEAPRGYFTFTGREADSIVLIGAGVGATPLMSVLRYLTDRGWSGEIFYLYACRSSADFLYREELEQLQRRHRNLHVLATMTRAAGTIWIGPEGRLTKDLIAGFVPEIARRRVHLCGPEPMMDEMRRILGELGVLKGQLKTEAFGTAKRAAIAAAPLPSVATAAATATVTFVRSGKSAPLPAGMTVLEAADSVGVPIENSCRSGTCGACKVRLLKGAVTMAVEDALEPAEKAQGWILACQAQSRADLAVDA